MLGKALTFCGTTLILSVSALAQSQASSRTGLNRSPPWDLGTPGMVNPISLVLSSPAACSYSAGQALQFDGVNDVVRIPDSASLDLSTAATIEFWFAPQEYAGTDFQRIIEKGDGVDGNSDRAYEIEFHQSNASQPGIQSAYFLGTDTYAIVFIYQTLTPGIWIHVCSTFNLAAGEIRVYVNGVLGGVHSGITQPIRNSSYPLILGAVPPFGKYYKGQMDEVRIWSVTRNAAEIASNYNRRVDPNTPGLVGYWQLDETTGDQVIHDASPAGNNGTLGNTSAPGSDDPTRVVSAAPIFAADAGPDCNSNGVPDACDIADGMSQDCNHNGVPDECDIGISGSTLSFAPEANYGVGGNANTVAIADLNGDGRPDMVVPNSTNVSVLLGNGDGTFQPSVDYDAGANPVIAAIGDLNGDGKPDVVVANAGGDNLSVFLGNGNGTFQSAINILVGSHPIGIALADLNHDSKLDLAVSNYASNNVLVLLGNGDGTFGPAVPYALGGNSANFPAIADLNNDGNADLAVPNGTNVSVLLGNGDGTFQATVDYAAGDGTNFVAVGDLNGDGRPDLVVANGGGLNLSVLLGNGNGTFQAALTVSTVSAPPSVAIADLNGDGKLDLVAPNTGGFSVFLGNGDGTFQTADNFAASSNSTFAGIGDLNSDGKLDLALAKPPSANVSVFLNSTIPHSSDCNNDGVPDECELTGNDCNGNGIPDSCDLANGTSHDCNHNQTPDECELAGHDCNGDGILDSCDITSGTSHDCNHNGVPDECEGVLAPTISTDPVSESVCLGQPVALSVVASGSPSPTYQWRKGGVNIDGATGSSYAIATAALTDAGSYDVVVTNSCGSVTSNPANLTVTVPLPAPRYWLTTYCPTSTITSPYLIGFTNDGPVAGSCWGQKASRMFAGRENLTNGKIWRARPPCVIQQFGPSLCAPESILIDQQARWQSLCTTPNLIIVGGCNTVSFINPSSGTICEVFPDSTFAHIGQMALDSAGRLFVGSVDGDLLNVIEGGVVDSFYSAPSLSPRAVAIDAADNVYLTCATDGVMRKIAADGTVINPSFATGLTGAVSQAIAPTGIFHGNLFVACGDRVMEVDLATGTSSVFLPCQESIGIAFDPDGFMYISATSQNRILRIGPALPGDMDGDGAVTLADVAGFAKALLETPDAPLPILTADMTDDGCADGRDVRAFVTTLMGP